MDLLKIPIILRSRIRIRIEVKSWIWIRIIKVMRIRNPRSRKTQFMKDTAECHYDAGAGR